MMETSDHNYLLDQYEDQAEMYERLAYLEWVLEAESELSLGSWVYEDYWIEKDQLEEVLYGTTKR